MRAGFFYFKEFIMNRKEICLFLRFKYVLLLY